MLSRRCCSCQVGGYYPLATVAITVPSQSCWYKGLVQIGVCFAMPCLLYSWVQTSDTDFECASPAVSRSSSRLTACRLSLHSLVTWTWYRLCGPCCPHSCFVGATGLSRLGYDTVTRCYATQVALQWHPVVVLDIGDTIMLQCT